MEGGAPPLAQPRGPPAGACPGGGGGGRGAGWGVGAPHRAAGGPRRGRIPEATLLGLALAGGALGGLAGMRLFHHKTRKARFFVGLPVMLALHLCILGALLFLQNR